MAESAQSLIREYDELFGDQGTWRNNWQELSEFANPRIADFNTERSPGQKRGTRVYDSTAIEAAERFASGLHNALTSEGQPWFYLRTADEDLNAQRDVKLWLEDTTKRMLGVFNSPFSNFHPSQTEKYLDIGVLGSACQFIGDKPGLGPFFQSIFLGHVVISTDDTGRVDTVFRVIKVNARQAIMLLGEKNTPTEIKEAFGKDKHDQKFKILHVVKPRKGSVFGRQDAKNMPFLSAWIWMDKTRMLREGGFPELPFIFSRWSVNSSEMYGRGPGHRALADVRTLNEMEKTQLIGLQKMIDPPLFIAHEGFLKNVDLRPSAQNRISQSLLKPSDAIHALPPVGRPDLGEAKEGQKRSVIRRAFYNDVFELPGPVSEKGSIVRMSATEVANRNRDRLSILGPIFSRLKVEDLSPMVFRTLNIMVRSNMVSPPPDVLMEADIEVQYVGPLAIAQGAGDVGSILQTIDALSPLAQIRPEVMDVINVDESATIVAEGLRMPTRGLHSPEEMKVIREQRARQAEENRQAELNRTDSESVKNLVEAEQAGTPT